MVHIVTAGETPTVRTLIWAPYLFQVDCDDLAVVDEPGALLHLDLVVKLGFNNGRVSLQADLERASLDVHDHISALNAKADIERHCQLWEDVKMDGDEVWFDSDKLGGQVLTESKAVWRSFKVDDGDKSKADYALQSCQEEGQK